MIESIESVLTDMKTFKERFYREYIRDCHFYRGEEKARIFRKVQERMQPEKEALEKRLEKVLSQSRKPESA